MRGRLNLFQAAMLRWRELYPYNAVHVAELPGPLDVAWLPKAVKFYLGQYLLPGMLLRSRRAFRPRYRFGEGWYNAVTSLELSPPLYAAVLRAAKAWGVTLNDLLLAMQLTALAPELQERLD